VAGGVAQAVELLPCKHKTPSSNPSATKKKTNNSKKKKTKLFLNLFFKSKFHNY
jgi:hypothetical protein